MTHSKYIFCESCSVKSVGLLSMSKEMADCKLRCAYKPASGIQVGSAVYRLLLEVWAVGLSKM